MILTDFSSIVHRKIHTSVAHAKPKLDETGQYITDDFINLTKHLILEDLFDVVQEYGETFGDLVICLDKAKGGYWRKDVYSGYKGSRKATRDKSLINYSEVFAHIDDLIREIKENLPWKVIDVQRAEADDVMLVLAREYNAFEKILILSPDKDMIQAQRRNDTVFQYSPFTNKWVTAETKSDDMSEWVLEHICLGDTADDVPKIVDHTEFSSAFLRYLNENDYTIKTPMDFKAATISREEKTRLLETFDVYKTNRKGESTGEKDVYKDIKFGPKALKKRIETFGSLDKWLDSHPLYRPHYERNFKLVMEEGIPTDIWNQIVLSYKEAETDYNIKGFEDYLTKNHLVSIKMNLNQYFKLNRELTADDFDW